jgi:prolyl-tRNA synthetase
LAIGGRDLENNTVEVARRDTLTKETLFFDGIEGHIKQLLDDIQVNIFKKASDFRTANTREVDSYEAFKVEIEKGGFLLCHWDGTVETEELIKNETKATIRCIPLEGEKVPGKCMVTGKPSAGRVIFARAY